MLPLLALAGIQNSKSLVMQSKSSHSVSLTIHLCAMVRYVEKLSVEELNFLLDAHTADGGSLRSLRRVQPLMLQQFGAKRSLFIIRSFLSNPDNYKHVVRCQTEMLAVSGKCRIGCSEELFRKR